MPRSQTPTRRHRSFRLAPSTLARLEQRSDETLQSQTALAERYIDEGLRLDDHPGVMFVGGPAGRRPRLVGTGLDLWEVIETVRVEGGSGAGAASYLAIQERVVQVAVRYYAAFAEEIDAWIEQNQRIAEREEAAARRAHDLLG